MKIYSQCYTSQVMKVRHLRRITASYIDITLNFKETSPYNRPLYIPINWVNLPPFQPWDWHAQYFLTYCLAPSFIFSSNSSNSENSLLRVRHLRINLDITAGNIALTSSITLSISARFTLKYHFQPASAVSRCKPASDFSSAVSYCQTTPYRTPPLQTHQQSFNVLPYVTIHGFLSLRALNYIICYHAEYSSIVSS